VVVERTGVFVGLFCRFLVIWVGLFDRRAYSRYSGEMSEKENTAHSRQLVVVGKIGLFCRSLL